MNRLLYIALFCLSAVFVAQGQDADTLDAIVFGNDTVMTKILPEVQVMPEPRTEFKNRRERRYYGRLLRDVKRTLPIAKEAGAMMALVNDTLMTIDGKRDQNQYLKSVEKRLFDEYEPVLRKMSMRQGRLLIKLIDRECQMTSYNVVKAYRGGMSAFFWQGVARIFGSDLKSSYDAEGDDYLIEEVVRLVELGAI